MQYDLIICGGTFDRLHAGHKAFLNFAFEKGKKVLIGLTSDAYIKKFKKNKNILPFSLRKKELEDFLQSEGLLTRAEIVAIDSKFDKTQIREDIKSALLVSEETYPTGLEINKERKDNGLAPLPLIVFPFVKNEQNEKISSTKIREGVFDRNGIFLPDSTLLSSTLFAPEILRKKLHEPFGKLFSTEIPIKYLTHPETIVTVGDVATKRLHELGVKQKLSVIDFVIERQKTQDSLASLGFITGENIVRLRNPAGSLQYTVWKELLGFVQNLKDIKDTVVIVDGEEDLLVIPLILMLPLGFTLFYGQPQKGIVVVEITEEVKGKTYNLLQEFTRK